MPRENGTGPRGMGRQAGRGAGYCSGLSRPGYTTACGGCRYGAGYGRGFRETGSNRDFGAGFGKMRRSGNWREGWFQSDLPLLGRPDPETDKRMLKRQAEDLQMELDAIRKRLGEIDVKPSPS